MGLALLAGGIAGSAIGVAAFAILRQMAQLDVVIKISPCFPERHRSADAAGKPVCCGAQSQPRREAARTTRLDRRPAAEDAVSTFAALHQRAVTSRGRALVGVLAAIMGVGGGFIMVPAMIYLLGMPATVVVGTSLFQIIFVTATVTILQAITTQTVDVVLAMLLIAGSVIGAQFGLRVGTLLRGDHLRVLLALLVLATAGKLAFDLIARPPDLYSVTGLPEPR